MADQQEILADKDRHLDGIPGPAKNGPPFSPGSNVGPTKLGALVSLIRSWVPEPGEEIGDPIQYVRKAIGDVVWGRGRPGVSLRELANRTDPEDPLRKALLALCYFRAAIDDATSGCGDEHPSIAQWPKEWRAMMTQASRDEFNVRPHDGYFIDFYTIFAAQNLLFELEEELQPVCSEPRLSVVRACRALLDRCPMPFAERVETAYEDDALIVLFDEDNPGRFRLAYEED
jgi:hypothetical protein